MELWEDLLDLGVGWGLRVAGVGEDELGGGLGGGSEGLWVVLALLLPSVVVYIHILFKS